MIFKIGNQDFKELVERLLDQNSKISIYLELSQIYLESVLID